MSDFEGNSTYAKYDAFDIDDFTENYRLKVTGYTGTAGINLKTIIKFLVSVYKCLTAFSNTHIV